jgi:hypothetical protein
MGAFALHWVATLDSLMQTIGKTITMDYVEKVRPVFSGPNIGHFTLVEECDTIIGGKRAVCPNGCVQLLNFDTRGKKGSSRVTLSCPKCRMRAVYVRPRDCGIKDNDTIMLVEGKTYMRTRFPIPINNSLQWKTTSDLGSSPQPSLQPTPGVSPLNSASDLDTSPHSPLQPLSRESPQISVGMSALTCGSSPSGASPSGPSPSCPSPSFPSPSCPSPSLSTLGSMDDVAQLPPPVQQVPSVKIHSPQPLADVSGPVSLGTTYPRLRSPEREFRRPTSRDRSGSGEGTSSAGRAKRIRKCRHFSLTVVHANLLAGLEQLLSMTMYSYCEVKM